MKSSALKILSIALIISFIGILSVYSSTYQKEDASGQRLYIRQLVWVLLGVVVFFLLYGLNYRRVWDWTYFLYIGMIIILLLVLAVGLVRSGAQRWLRIAWFNFQPSEFAKLAIVIFLSRYYSSKSKSDISLPVLRFGMFRSLILPFILVAIPMLMIIGQPDLGSGMMIFFLFFAFLYCGGVRPVYIFILLFLCGLSFPILWHFLRDYQKDRLLVFLDPNIDPLGAGYTIIQSKTAIGSGGLFGKGWLAGTQTQLHFLPESHTDFIFATFAEQWGLLGSAVLLFLYYLLIREAIVIAKRASDTFAKLLSCGIAFMFSIQVFVNISMNLGLAPVVGLPLPLMSYGGSCVVVSFFALGLLASINR